MSNPHGDHDRGPYGDFQFGDDRDSDPGVPADVSVGGSLEYDEVPDVDVISDGVSCENCEHRTVCQLYNAMRQNVEQHAQQTGESPVDPAVLAVRCEMFEPVDPVELVREADPDE